MFNFDKSINSILGRKLNHPNLLSKKTANDWDGDGVPNKKDCQPRNFMRQDKLYRIFDTQKQVYVGGIYKSGPMARRRADKLDNDYGAYRYKAIKL